MPTIKTLSTAPCAAHGVVGCAICSPTLNAGSIGKLKVIDGVISPGDGTDIVPDPTRSEALAVESLEAVATVRGPVKELQKAVKKLR